MSSVTSLPPLITTLLAQKLPTRSHLLLVLYLEWARCLSCANLTAESWQRKILRLWHLQLLQQASANTPLASTLPTKRPTSLWICKIINLDPTIKTKQQWSQIHSRWIHQWWHCLLHWELAMDLKWKLLIRKLNHQRWTFRATQIPFKWWKTTWMTSSQVASPSNRGFSPPMDHNSRCSLFKEALWDYELVQGRFWLTLGSLMTQSDLWELKM